MHTYSLNEKTEKRRCMNEKRLKGELPRQRIQRLVRAFNRSVKVPPIIPSTCPYIKLGHQIHLLAPEMGDLSYLFIGHYGCPDDEFDNPRSYGLLLSATACYDDYEAHVEKIEDGCAVGCAPISSTTARNIFELKPADNRKDVEHDYLTFGRPIYIQLANATEKLYLRSETPLVDGKFGPNDHNPLRLNVLKDGYAKWKAVHWNKYKRFETEGLPIPPCMRIVIQHVMTGKCLAVENRNWYKSLLGYECGVSVHTYSDVHRNETSECIWTMFIQESHHYKYYKGDSKRCNAK